MALVGEVVELVEVFQWLSPDEAASVMQDEASAQAVRDELGDVLGYLIRLADMLDIDLAEAVWAKVIANESRYPVDLARGSRAKHSDLGG